MYRIKKLFSQSIKNLYHLAQAVVANILYGFPSKKFHPHTKYGCFRFLIKFIGIFNSNWKNFGVGVKVIGVTGTDGKTTTTQMIVKILEETEKKVAMASTINFSINGVEEKNLSHYTTESAFGLQKFIKKAVDSGCEYLVLETSSHSLDQYRVWGVEYKTAVVTNVTREHLDYHKTIENYRKTKLKLFSKTETVIVNTDMEKPEEFLGYNVKNKFGYTAKDTGLDSRLRGNDKEGSIMTEEDVKIIRAENIKLGISGSEFMIHDICFMLNVLGDFNIENALAATCVGISEGIDLETCAKALGKIKGVPGRMENIPNNKGLNIIVDFALTPNALERLYKTLNSVRKSPAKIIAVFGACGERDRGKRPITGKIVSDYADYIILTNDEPYHESPQQIINEIADGVENKTENQNFWKIMDRREAIAKALQIAKEGDMIVVTGMGNFETMVVGDKKIPWNDKKVIEEELAKM